MAKPRRSLGFSLPTSSSNQMDHLSTRFNEGHYYLNSLLCLPFPIALVTRLTPTLSFSTTTLLLSATPVLLSLSVFSKSSSDNLGKLLSHRQKTNRGLTSSLLGRIRTLSESLHASLTFQLRLFNLFGLFFSRNQLGTGLFGVTVYFVAWLGQSFPLSFEVHNELMRSP